VATRQRQRRHCDLSELVGWVIEEAQNLTNRLDDVTIEQATDGDKHSGEMRGRAKLGLAGRALAALATWAFEAIDMVRLELLLEPWNVGSIRTAERTGFVREGLLRQAQRVGDERRDMFIYARLRDDLWV
jgi:hypothetical protein